MVTGKGAAESTKPRQGSKQKPDKPDVSAKARQEAKTLGDRLVGEILSGLRNVREWRDVWVKLAENQRRNIGDTLTELVNDHQQRCFEIFHADGADRWAVNAANYSGVPGEPSISLKLSIVATAPLIGGLIQGSKMTLVMGNVKKHDAAKYQPGVIGSLGLKDPEHAETGVGKGGELKQPRTGPGAPSDPDAEAQLGRGLVKPDEAMPGDIGPMMVPPPVDGDGNPVAHDPQTGEAQEPAHG
jgi:hypothetical protein